MQRFLRQTVFCGVCGTPITSVQERAFRKIKGVVRVTHRACQEPPE